MSAHSSLTSELAALRAASAGVAGLASSGLVERACRAGQYAPDFALPDTQGRPVRLSRRLRSGPVILTFYRGSWCPYCNLELRAYQALAGRIVSAGVQLIAVSPQLPRETASTVPRNALGFEMLSDAGSTVAHTYGIACDVEQAPHPLSARLGHTLPEENCSDGPLPIPATYVIAPSGEITLSFVDTDHRRRLEPAQALAAAASAASQGSLRS